MRLRLPLQAGSVFAARRSIPSLKREECSRTLGRTLERTARFSRLSGCAFPVTPYVADNRPAGDHMHQHGFTLVQETQVSELSSTARLWRHDATGGRVLSFLNADENKVFGVSFRTPPADSTGVAHILEHSVLCGSEKYPVKEPFVELLKGSLQTFLNAFTYPDKTCYPVASANLRDFRNLTDVYLDAVFFPRITEAIFQQEGWHFEPGEDGVLTYKGVVYNEMKGAFSAPESVLGRYCLHALFPDTVYGLESGGDPKVIPSLTYADFMAFHRSYYHPSNARFFFWGDDPEEERLEQLGVVLARFGTLAVDSAIGIQQPLPAPRTLTVPFAASEGDKGMAVVNWLGPDCMDVELVLAFHMLEHMLLGMPASPLRRALIESGLGEDLAGQGLETELRQLTFDVGLKGVAMEDVGKVEELILSTLQSLARDGIPAEAVEAAVNSVEFSLRENNSGRFPVGLSVMLRSLTTWMHDGDPLAPLRFEGPLAVIKARVAENKGWFEGLISRWLLDNTHRVTVILAPDAGLAARQEQEETQVLASLAEGMTPEIREALARNAEALNAWQAAPDSPEALATIPRLTVDDLPRVNAHIPTEQESREGVPVFFHGLPTGGIVYAEACFDLSGVPARLVPLLPLFGRALLEMGTQDRDFVALNMAIARKTGGMDADTLFVTHADTRVPAARLVLSGKCAPDKVEDLFGLMVEVLTRCSFADKDRFSRMALEEKARQEHGLVPSGHMVVATRLRAALSGTGWLSDQTGGIGYLTFLRGLVARLENDWPGVLADLEALRSLIFTRGGLILNITALPEQQAPLGQLAGSLARSFASGESAPQAWETAASVPAEALLLPAQVNYVGKGINLFDAGYSWHGSASVILKFLRTGYLWEKVRVQGGAYGCMCGLDRMSGAFFMVSYRDPNVLPTLDVYDKAAAYLQSHPLTRAELDAAIVGAIGELDTYLLPDAKGAAALTRHLAADTEERRQRLRDEILSTSQDHVRQFGKALEAFRDRGLICALGGNALERAAKDRGWETRKVL